VATRWLNRLGAIDLEFAEGFNRRSVEVITEFSMTQACSLRQSSNTMNDCAPQSSDTVEHMTLNQLSPKLRQRAFRAYLMFERVMLALMLATYFVALCWAVVGCPRIPWLGI
jgi:hypothetical protein